MGTVKYVGTGAANLTHNNEYPIVSVSSEVGAVTAAIVDDNGVLWSANLSSADYQVTALYAMTKVI